MQRLEMEMYAMSTPILYDYCGDFDIPWKSAQQMGLADHVKHVERHSPERYVQVSPVLGA